MTFSIQTAASNAKKSANQVAKLGARVKQQILLDVAENLIANQKRILAENAIDIAQGTENGLSDAMLDRLLLDEKRLLDIAGAVRNIALQEDPVGSMSGLKQLPSGIRVGKMKIPLGVIAMVYESRPNVTIDAAALCFKAGNAVILRGGKEALHSNLALAECFHQALEKHQVASTAVTVIPDPDREIMAQMLMLNEEIDLVIPRGGEGLIRYVSTHSRIPVIQHFKGVCHLYVAQDADLTKALNILENGKTQRTGVCNALETLLVDASIAPTFLPMAATMLQEHGVRIHACSKSIEYFAAAEAATDDDWDAEYLALEIAVRVVSDYDAAVAHIEEYGSGHTEVIVTQDYSMAQRFTRDINSSVVMVNASSRFSDGGELGLGAEIGISTSKLHAYGPMGVESLTTEKFVVLGEGETRS
ncbi:MAG: glutamate-5-semialdehyde dehydrogenase [Aestuariibacter sp.]